MRALRGRRQRHDPDIGSGPPISRRAAPPAAFLRTLLEDHQDAVIACDADGTIVLSNRKARELGAPDPPVPADKWREGLGLRDREGAAVELPLAGALAGEDVHDREVEIWIGDEPHVVTLDGGPLRDDGGEVLGAAIVLRDVTARTVADDRIRLESEIAARIASGVALVRAADGEIVYANDAWDTMLGYEPGGLIGRHLSQVTTPNDQAPETRAHEIFAALDRSGVWSGEIHSVRNDGTRFWTAAKISTLEHPEHGPTWIVVVTDISGRKAAEETLRIAEQRFRKVFEEAPVGIALVGNDTRVIDVNEALSEITGYGQRELIGMTLTELTHPDDRDYDAEQVAKVFSGELERYRISTRYVTNEGEVIAVALTMTYVRDPADRPLHAIAIVEPLMPFVQRARLTGDR